LAEEKIAPEVLEKLSVRCEQDWTDKPIDVICMTSKEYKLRRLAKNPYYENIEESGRIIYDRDRGK
jgi:hypothetical protein